jgi:hypothetical protein
VSKRLGGTARTMAFLQAHPRQWIAAIKFEDVGGRQAWRTRLSEARLKFQAAGEGTIENRQRHMRTDGREWVLSEYRFVPQEPLPVRVDENGQAAFL